MYLLWISCRLHFNKLNIMQIGVWKGIHLHCNLANGCLFIFITCTMFSYEICIEGEIEDYHTIRDT